MFAFRYCLIFKFPSLSSRAFLSYHIFFPLSIPFFFFLDKFFRSGFSLPRFRDSFLTLPLSYPFVISFFEKFFPLSFSPFFLPLSPPFFVLFSLLSLSSPFSPLSLPLKNPALWAGFSVTAFSRNKDKMRRHREAFFRTRDKFP